MAHGTICPILPIMLVFMTRDTTGRQTTIRPTLMAFRTGQPGVFSIQRETGVRVVKRRSTPTLGCVAGTAICSEFTVVVVL
jgi:hypothetical protein